ncbi:hypothetical protein [Pandoravirus japonicus]|uniref:Uncharacterized protein n=1 Tax=Pandoravirus japonicus TaxID=2823154 RepID=A0A811BRH3_9VIRU|nr:hypothetical protein [Pandoravirus japonicus]
MSYYRSKLAKQTREIDEEHQRAIAVSSAPHDGRLAGSGPSRRPPLCTVWRQLTTLAGGARQSPQSAHNRRKKWRSCRLWCE